VKTRAVVESREKRGRTATNENVVPSCRRTSIGKVMEEHKAVRMEVKEVRETGGRNRNEDDDKIFGSRCRVKGGVWQRYQTEGAANEGGVREDGEKKKIIWE